MVTLIAVYGPRDFRGKARLIGRCDAKCYLSKHHCCDCICGGKNHRKGLDTAVQNTRECADQWLLDYAKSKGLGVHYTAELGRSVRQQQLPLFDCSSFSAQVLGT
jgi:hypothetical protein